MANITTAQNRKAAISPEDPAYTLVTAVDEMNRRTLKELTLLVEKMSDDVVASSVRAEQGAKAHAEAIITQSAAWIDERVRAAGAEVVQGVRDEVQAMNDLTEIVARTLWVMMLAGTGLTVANGLALWFFR